MQLKDPRLKEIFRALLEHIIISKSLRQRGTIIQNFGSFFEF